MARDICVYLQDMYYACVAIVEVIEGVTLDDYRGRRAIIDFRNLPTHDYGAIDRSICMSIQAKASHLRWRSTRSISCSKDAAAAAT